MGLGLRAQTYCASSGSGVWSSAFSCTGSSTTTVYEVSVGDTVTVDASTASPIDTLYVNGVLLFTNGRKINLKAHGLIQVAASGSVVGGNNGSGFTFAGGTSVLGSFNVPGAAHAVNGYTAFNTGTPLPVSWLEVNAQWNSDELEVNWSTASELMNDHFEVELSIDGIRFESLLFVSSKAMYGTSHNVLHYGERFDPGTRYAEAERIYVRIKQVDFDGSEDHSIVVDVAHTVEQVEFMTDGYSVEVRSKDFVQGELLLLTLTGKLVSAQTMNGTHTSIEVVVPGSYIVMLNDPNAGLFTRRLVINK